MMSTLSLNTEGRKVTAPAGVPILPMLVKPALAALLEDLRT